MRREIFLFFMIVIAVLSSPLAVLASQDQSDEPIGSLIGSFASTGTHLRIGIDSSAHYGDYTIGYGFQYPIGFEHAAVAWWGEGLTFGYTFVPLPFPPIPSFVTSYESEPGVTGLTVFSENVIIDTSTVAIYETVLRTTDGRVELVHNFHFQKETKFVILTVTVKNIGTDRLDHVRYRRIWDFDMDNTVNGGDWFDVDLSRYMLYAWETHYAALAASSLTPPTEWDVDAWDDISTYYPGPSVYMEPFPVPGDYNVRLEWVYSSIVPGGQERIIMYHMGGDNKADLDNSYELAERKVLPVGGVWTPIDKFELLAPYIGLASIITVATISIVYVKYRKKKQN